MKINEIIEFKNSKEWIEFDRYYNYSSFMKKAGFYKFEDPNTNFLTSVLNETFEGTYYPLKLLIELISQKSDCFNKLDLLSDYKIEVINNIEPRKSVKNLKPDLLLCLTINGKPYLIVIEAKLRSLESLDQCKKYEETINKEYRDYTRIYLFLDRDTKNNISGNFIRITYSDLLNSIYTPCLYKTKNLEFKQQLEEYIRSFKEFYLYDDMDYNYMPLSHEGKELTLNLWNKHNKTIYELFKDQDMLNRFYKSNDVNLRTFIINTLILHEKLEIPEKFQKLLESLLVKANNKNLFNKKLYNNVEFVYQLFKDISINEDLKNEKIPNSIININNWKLIVPSKELDTIPDSRKRYYRLKKKDETPITINGEEYLYCTFVNSNDIEELMNSVVEIYPEYKDKIGRNLTLK